MRANFRTKAVKFPHPLSTFKAKDTHSKETLSSPFRKISVKLEWLKHSLQVLKIKGDSSRRSSFEWSWKDLFFFLGDLERGVKLSQPLNWTQANVLVLLPWTIQPLSSYIAGLWFPNALIALVLFFKRRWERILIKLFTFDLRDTEHTLGLPAPFSHKVQFTSPLLAPYQGAVSWLVTPMGTRKSERGRQTVFLADVACGSGGAVLATDMIWLTHC